MTRKMKGLSQTGAVMVRREVGRRERGRVEVGICLFELGELPFRED